MITQCSPISLSNYVLTPMAEKHACTDFWSLNAFCSYCRALLNTVLESQLESLQATPWHSTDSMHTAKIIYWTYNVTYCWSNECPLIASAMKLPTLLWQLGSFTIISCLTGQLLLLQACSDRPVLPVILQTGNANYCTKATKTSGNTKIDKAIYLTRFHYDRYHWTDTWIVISSIFDWVLLDKITLSPAPALPSYLPHEIHFGRVLRNSSPWLQMHAFEGISSSIWS